MRKGLFACISLFTGVMLSSQACADAIGMPTQLGRVGLTFGSAYFLVTDPSGSTRSAWAARPFNLVYSQRFGTGWRHWEELFFQQGSLEAGTSTIGQTIKQAGFRASLQHSINLGPIWTPWFGGGIQVSRDRFHERHTVDAQGYLNQVLPDRSQTETAVILNASSEWRMDWNWDIGVKLEQAVPLRNEGVKTSSASLLFLYRF